MTVYFIITLLSFLLLLPEAKSDNKYIISEEHTIKRSESIKIGYFIFSVILIFVAGFRFRVGADFGSYYYYYIDYVKSLPEAISNLDEPILPLIDRIAYFFVKDNNLGGTLFPAIITLFLILRTTYKYSTDLFVSGMLVLFTCWSSCFNGVRQALAAAILYFGYPYLRDKKFIKWCIIVFIAFLSHKSAAIMIFLFFVCRNKITAKNVLLLALGSLVILFNYDRLFGFLDTLMSKDYAYETNAYILNAVNPLRVLIHCAPACYYLFKYWNIKKTEMQTLCLNFVIVRAVMMIAASGSTMLGRIGMYTSTFCLIAIPELNRGLDNNTRRIMEIIILVLYCFVWLYEISGSGSLNNFQFIWQASNI